VEERKCDPLSSELKWGVAVNGNLKKSKDKCQNREGAAIKRHEKNGKGGSGEKKKQEKITSRSGNLHNPETVVKKKKSETRTSKRGEG